MLRTAWRCLPAICSSQVWSPCTPQPASSLQFPIIIPSIWMAAKRCLISFKSSFNRHTCCQHSGRFPLHFFTTKIFLFIFFKLGSHCEKLMSLWSLLQVRVKIWHSSPAENQSSWSEEYSRWGWRAVCKWKAHWLNLLLYSLLGLDNPTHTVDASPHAPLQQMSEMHLSLSSCVPVCSHYQTNRLRGQCLHGDVPTSPHCCRNMQSYPCSCFLFPLALRLASQDAQAWEVQTMLDGGFGCSSYIASLYLFSASCRLGIVSAGMCWWSGGGQRGRGDSSRDSLARSRKRWADIWQGNRLCANKEQPRLPPSSSATWHSGRQRTTQTGSRGSRQFEARSCPSPPPLRHVPLWRTNPVHQSPPSVSVSRDGQWDGATAVWSGSPERSKTWPGAARPRRCGWGKAGSAGRWHLPTVSDRSARTQRCIGDSEKLWEQKQIVSIWPWKYFYTCRFTDA